VAALRAEHDARLAAECPFAPDTSKPTVIGYHDRYHPPEPSARSVPLSISAVMPEGLDVLMKRLREHGAAREARTAQIRKEEEARRLAECTFAPDTSKPRVAATPGPAAAVVKGLDRYMELKALAEQQEKERRERAARVFNENPGDPGERGVTVPRPFRLGPQRREREGAPGL
jgi:hypothetical protein